VSNSEHFVSVFMASTAIKINHQVLSISTLIPTDLASHGKSGRYWPRSREVRNLLVWHSEY